LEAIFDWLLKGLENFLSRQILSKLKAAFEWIDLSLKEEMNSNKAEGSLGNKISNLPSINKCCF
jgi:hypothetical protein